MSRNWTDEQKLAIYSPTSNILVSAGAGSGKTAVLTERVCTLLKNKININELLVLTFTKAAAEEMKDRIRKAIKKEPTLHEQLDLLDSAYITTFDSYALSLVKKYHYLLGVSNNIKIVNDAALKLEKYKIIDQVMEEKYLEGSKTFKELIYMFCLKDDDAFKNILFELNNKFDLIVEKEQFLKDYIFSLIDDKVKCVWKRYLEFISSKLEEIRELYYEIENSLESKEDEELFETFSALLEPLIDSDDFNTIASNISFSLNNVKKTKNINETFINNKKKIGEIRDEIKKLIDCDNEEKIKKALKDNFKYEKEIIEIAIIINERINSLKLSNEMFEFVDIAKMAIKLVKNNPSVAEEIKNSIKEIMLDEYQDTSDLQEILISYISNNNVYMVGDIKQSIYGFRNANPKIFLDKYNTYKKDESKGKVIDLMRNFRSRKEVLDDINLLFNEIMQVEYGGIQYNKGHEFIHGNKAYNDNVFTDQSNELEIYNYDNSNKEFDNEEVEAFIIGKDILNKISHNYMVYDKDENVKRKMEYKDITILIDRKGSFETYQKIFEYLQIPLSLYKNSNITISNEISYFKNIFKLIYKYHLKEFDNEFKHAFMSIGRSFLFEYDDNYLFNLIVDEKYYDNSIYETFKNIILNINSLSLKEMINAIIEETDIYYKLIKCGDIENSSAIIEYICSLINDLSDLNYTIENLIEYFDSVIQKDLKIELPVRKSTINSVKIMTIHGSKGLEFSLCYFAGFNKEFSEFDSKKKFIYDDELGLLLPLYIEGNKYTNIGKYLYMHKYYLNEISEKIRLLYVALSRAKEKMIIVGDFKDQKKTKTSLIDSRSFYDFIKYSENKLSKYYKFIELKYLDLTHNYKFYKSLKKIDKDNTLINHKMIQIKNEIREESSFSKKQKELINEDIVNIMNKGNYLHSILEKIDFNRYDLSNLNINDRRIIEKFINCPLINNNLEKKIYKEYEFIYEENDDIKHGFIDLLVVYNDYIDIIDYKLSNVADEAYIEQLKGYQKYISKISNKTVNLYLYSLYKSQYTKVG